MKYIIGVDTGGTFTDVTVLSEKGEVHVNKAPTTPYDFSEGVMNALEVTAQSMGTSRDELLRQCLTFKHGTTVATNALITREGAKVGLITTHGFEDTTLIMRAIGRVAGLSEEELKHQATARKPVPLVPKKLIKGVTERIDYQGRVLIPINEQEAREAIRSLIEDHKVDAIAVNFLFGFMNPIHENRIRELIDEMYGENRVFLALASELVPVIREYARSNTVIMNAFLGQTMAKYIGGLSKKLKSGGLGTPLLIMQANGGITHEEEMTAIGTLSSGPAGGILATKYMADVLGHSNVISTDMGGTSFDVGLISDGFWHYARNPIVERFHITWPMIDIESIGAGGGTIARVDPVTGRLIVGPKSAGAMPGPVCYDIGGTEPAITDADLILGIIDPNYFLGGRMKLNKPKAEKALEEKIAKPLGMSVVEAAAGIYDVINSHMSDLIRKQVVRIGHVPEEFVIYSFGGAGPVHAAAYGAELGVEKIYVFPTSAVFSAFGIATADIVHTYRVSQRYMMPVDPKVLNDRLNEIESGLMEIMLREGLPKETINFRRIFYMRYRRQLNEIEVPVPRKDYTEEDIHWVMDEFDRRYEDVFGVGSAYREAGIEIISFSIDAIGATTKPVLRSFPERGKDASAAHKGERQVFFTGDGGGFQNTAIYEYERLRPGNMIKGPTIIETPITTVAIPPKRTATVDRYLNIEISM